MTTILKKNMEQKMKIRIATTSPRNYTAPGFTIWNVQSIDEFVDRFMQNDQLVIGDADDPDGVGVRVPVRNFVVHNKYIATFETQHPLEYSILIMCALCSVDASADGAAFHNIKVDVIPAEQDPLKNPKAEASRRASGY